MTLTQTAILTRRVILISSISLFLGMVSFLGYRVWYAYYLSTLPPVEEKPDTKFGTLPLPDLPIANVSSSNFSYSLDTTTGGLPDLGKIIKVFFIPKTYATLLAPEKSQSLASKFDIRSEPEVLSETLYRFRTEEKAITIDLDTGNFTYLVEKSPEQPQSLIDSDDKLINDLKNLLNSKGLLDEGLTKGRFKVSLLKFEGENLVPVESRSEAQAAQISIWPQDLNQIPIATPDINQSLITAIVTRSANDLKNYLSLKYTYWPVDETTFATYPLKTTREGYDDLISGKGVVVVEPERPEVSITSVYLAYFQSEKYTPYLQPVFVFEGPNFVSFVPAIKEQFFSQTR